MQTQIRIDDLTGYLIVVRGPLIAILSTPILCNSENLWKISDDSCPHVFALLKDKANFDSFIGPLTSSFSRRRSSAFRRTKKHWSFFHDGSNLQSVYVKHKCRPLYHFACLVYSSHDNLMWSLGVHELHVSNKIRCNESLEKFYVCGQNVNGRSVLEATVLKQLLRTIGNGIHCTCTLRSSRLNPHHHHWLCSSLLHRQTPQYCRVDCRSPQAKQQWKTATEGNRAASSRLNEKYNGWLHCCNNNDVVLFHHSDCGKRNQWEKCGKVGAIEVWWD